ncbi:hypothetical protein [uncultured Roseobacter sp.]|uniref:hypothetical protein n=1 Tax=uncultured Roseobacter sp. TaxID=114847 RepID=UPI00260F4A12|nr:hypothetical protein [uncultured Roseobacter sp.]
MMHAPIALASTLFLAISASANVYSCQGETFCMCQKAKGCSGIDQYLTDDQTEICRNSKRTFEATAQWRKIVLTGEGLKISLKEVRPYFSDVDWYQANATENRGQINLGFDNETDQTDFQIRQMAQGSVNNHDWTLSGVCEVIE